jgi:hypothetical protein
MSTTMKPVTTVSKSALVARINRRLRKSREALRRARDVTDGQGYRYPNPELGRHYLVDLDHNFILAKDLDLEEFGRELGAMARSEQLLADESD